jgi:hypothetical protein
MADLWYYAHDGVRTGPCSARQLQELAAAGSIVPTDTIWKEGVAQGALAKNVKHLFPTAPVKAVDTVVATIPEPPAAVAPGPVQAPAPAPVEPAAATPQEQQIPSAPPAESAAVSSVLTKEAALKPPPKTLSTGEYEQQMQTKKAKAIAVQGAVIVSQDGTRVSYTRKCTACGQRDDNRLSMVIRNGMFRANFFCPKCKKNRRVEINCTFK